MVESTGFRDDGWLDVNGSPYTDALKLTERFRRPDYGTLDIAGHGRRSQGLHAAVDRQGEPEDHARLGADRVHLPGERKRHPALREVRWGQRSE